MKLISCYTVFNGLELLDEAIRTISDHVDGVVICYQSISNTGHAMIDKDVEILKSFVGRHRLISYNTDLNVNTKENERRKHNLMIDAARKLGATHFLMGATDHFYDPVEFQFAKRLVDAMDWDATFTSMYTYYKHPTWQLTPIENYYMPFICKLYPETKVERMHGFPLLVDPSVQINTAKKWYLFREFEIMMHHYSMIRIDIEQKFKNAAASIRWKKEQVDTFVNEYLNYDLKENQGIKYFQGRKVKVVRDYFNLSGIFEFVPF